MSRNVVVILDQKEGRDLVKKICRQNKISLAEFEELVGAEVEQVGKQKKRGLYELFDDILDRIEMETGDVP